MPSKTATKNNLDQYTEIKLSDDYPGHRMFYCSRKILHVVEPEYKLINFHHYNGKTNRYKTVNTAIPVLYQVWTYGIYGNVNTGKECIRQISLALTQQDPLQNPDIECLISYIPNCGYDGTYGICFGTALYSDIDDEYDEEYDEPIIDDPLVIIDDVDAEVAYAQAAFKIYSTFWGSQFNVDLHPRVPTGVYNGNEYCFSLDSFVKPEWGIEYLQSEDWYNNFYLPSTYYDPDQVVKFNQMIHPRWEDTDY